MAHNEETPMAPRLRASNVADPQVVRALALLMEMARTQRGVLLKSFADKRGYPLRAVYRARDVLVKAGAPIRPNPDSLGRWQLMDGWLPPAVIGAAQEELMALFVARHLAPGLRGTTVARSLDSLWSKLASPTPQQALTFGDPPLSVRGVAAIDYAEHRITIDRLRASIDHRHAVQIQYRAADGAVTEREIEPGLLHWDGALEAMYAPSWCRLRDAVRVFAVHRILAIDPLPDEPARSVPIRRTLERAFRVWYRNQVEHVVVSFTSRVAQEIRERRWHASQRLIDTSDGGVHLHLDVSAPEELERWLLGYGPDARVIEPVRLADGIRRSHAQAAEISEMIEARRPIRARGISGSTATRDRRAK
jgi:predicted DNA-binding transcriptional regulator YafY